MNETFNEAVEKTIKKKKVHADYEMNISPTTLHFIKILKGLREVRQWARRYNTNGRNNAVIRLLSNKINNLAKIVKDRIRLDRQAAFISKCNKIRPGPAMFRQIKQVSGYKRFQKIPEELPINNVVSTDRAAHVEAFADYFENTYDAAINRQNQDQRRILEQELLREFGNFSPAIQFTNNELACLDEGIHNEDLFISTDTVISYAAKINNKTSHGIDSIPNYLLKRCPFIFYQQVGILINNMSNTGFTPEKWKMAMMTPIHKAGKSKDDIRYYRPISLLPNLSKLWERTMLERLEHFMENNGLNKENQFGFTKGLSTQHALTIMGSKIASSINKKIPIIAASLDLEKCYDSVCPLLLTKKLKNSEFSHHWTRTIFNFLRHRKFAVKIGDNISTTRTARTGLPQGSVVAPGLFKFFSHDLPQPDQSRGMSSLSFADDHIVLAASRPLEAAASLSAFLDEIHEYYETNGISCNKEKSNVIIFTGVLNRLPRLTRKEVKEAVVRMDGQPLARTNQIKYLGVILNVKYSFVKHIQQAISKAASVTGIMKGILARKALLWG